MNAPARGSKDLPGAEHTPPEVGARAAFSRTITQSDITLYAGLTGDFAPHHVNVEFGRGTRFGTTIAHGLFTASLVDGALTALFPQGSVSVQRALTFTAPVRPGDTVTAVAEVTRVDGGGRLVTLATACTNQRGEVVVSGTATERLLSRPVPPSPPEGEGGG